MAVLQLELPPSVAKGEAFLLTDWRCSAAEIAERRCAAEKTAPQKEHTSLKAHRAREFQSKGILLRVFALVCLIFYVACSTATCAQRSNKDQGQDQEEEEEEQEEEEEANEEEETAKNVRRTISVFQHANCRDHP